MGRNLTESQLIKVTIGSDFIFFACCISSVVKGAPFALTMFWFMEISVASDLKANYMVTLPLLRARSQDEQSANILLGVTG